MKKVSRILICSAMAVMLSLSLFACSEKTYESTRIGTGYDGCVAEARVEVNQKGEILVVRINEYFDPISAAWAGATTATIEEPTIEFKNGYGPSAKFYEYIMIDGKAFKGSVVDSKGVYAGQGDASAITNLAEYIKGEGMQWYYDAIKANKLFAAKLEDATVVPTTKALTSSYESLSKKDSTYWAEKGEVLGFNGNIKILQEFLIANGFAGTDSIKIEDKKVVINGITTNATIANANTYVKIAKAAYDDAITQSKAK